jgi:hypothetical protein
MSTTRLVGLLIVHGRWVYDLDHNGESGDKRGNDKARTRIRAESTLGPSACSRVSCMVLGVRVLPHLSNNTSVQLTRTN